MSANDELQAHTCEKVMEFYEKPQDYVKKSHNVANNVAQRNSQDLERVADTSKTIDHIVDVNKKLSLNEQWIKGKLEEYKKYYCKTKWFEDIFQARCYSKDTEDEWWALENEKYTYNNIYHTKDIEVLAPMPSYEEWRSLQSSWVDEMDKATRFKKALDNVCEEYNLKLPILETENDKLKELLKECRDEIKFMYDTYGKSFPKPFDNSLLTKIDEVLK